MRQQGREERELSVRSNTRDVADVQSALRKHKALLVLLVPQLLELDRGRGCRATHPMTSNSR